MADRPDNNLRGKQLDDARRALLKKRLRGIQTDAGQERGIRVLESGTQARASYAQSRLWFLDKLYDATPAYHMYRALRLRGELNENALRAALDELVTRHAVLRTSFFVRDGELYQDVAAPCALPFSIESLERTEDPEAALAERLPQEVGRPFDLERPPFMRAVLFILAHDEQVLLLVTHHIVSDEWSNELLAEELAERYRAIVAGREPHLSALSVTYADYAEWQRERVESIRAEQLDYWRGKLAGELPPLDLPFDHVRPPRPSLEGGLLRRKLPAALSRAIDELTRTAGVTPFILLLAAFKVLLHRYTGQDDIVVGVPAANRGTPEAEALVGLFLNTLVMRSHPDGKRTFVDYLGEVKSVALESFEHQELPLELLVAELQPDRDLSHNPLFQVMFVHSSDAGSQVDFGSVTSSEVHLDPGVAKFDLTLFTAWQGDELELLAEYSADLFDASTIDDMLGAFEMLLAGIVRNPKSTLAALPLLAEHGRADLIAALRGPDPGPDREPTWLHAFAAVVEGTPDAVAVMDDAESITYAELDRRTRAVAASLQAAGVARGEFIGVYLERSVDQIVAVLGAMRAGAAYVPLDPAYPEARLAAVLHELERSSGGDAVRVLVKGDRGSALPDTILSLRIDDAVLGPQAPAPDMPAPADPAYAIFTSGSTGQPKGVVVSHANLAHSNAARSEFYGDAVGRFLLLSSFAFDSSIAGIFWTLGSGGSLLLGPPGFERDPREVARLVGRHRATHTLMLPALYELVLETAGEDTLASLRTVIVAGEACSPSLAQLHARMLPNAVLYNEYGPTEASVWSTVYRCSGQEQDSVPIGLPIPGMRAYLVDAAMELVPRGAAGELCVAGEGVSGGYIGRPELTEQSFVTDLQDAGVTMYRTGDRARLHDGQLRYLGRVDEQIKVRGYRIEPAEIVSCLQSSADVLEAAIVAIGERAGDRKLAAYLVPAEGCEIDVDALRQKVRAALPDYMVPSVFVALSSLPRMPNGKLDIARLPAAEPAGATERKTPAADPDDEVLAKVLDVWRRVLDTDVGPDDDFFDVGGHSLLGVSLMMSIERAFGVELPLAALFESPTAAGLAARVRDSRETARSDCLIPIQPHGSKPPIFCIHGGARLLAKHLDPDQPIYLLFHDIGEADAELESVESVAAAYLEEMRRVQPHGPFYLHGFSYGGMLTYEIAMRLRDEGERIGLFVLLDPPPLINTSLLKVQMRHKLGQMQDSGSRAGFLARELPKMVWGRVKNVWRQSQLAYYRIAAKSGLIYSIASLVALLGIATIQTTGLQLGRHDWRPASVALPIQEGHLTEIEFVPGLSGLHEIELAVDRSVPAGALAQTVFALKTPSELDIAWSIWSDGERIAGGTATDYHYLDLKPRTVFGEYAYTLFQIPMSRNAEHLDSYGLRGSFTWGRGMGAVKLDAGETYTLRASVGRTFAELAKTNPHLDVRFNRRAFLERRDAVVSQGFVGFAFIGLGLLLAGIAWLRKRQSVPSKLIEFRNLRHNIRLSRRYVYRPYPGDAHLFLPERNPDIVENTIQSWRSVIGGDLRVDVIEGARRHLDLIDVEHGAEVARRFAEQLAAARQGDTEDVG